MQYRDHDEESAEPNEDGEEAPAPVQQLAALRYTEYKAEVEKPLFFGKVAILASYTQNQILSNSRKKCPKKIKFLEIIFTMN